MGNIIIIGLGTVGLPTAVYLTQFKQFSVHGFDISSKAVHRARSCRVAATALWNELPVADVYIITVSTSLKEDSPDMSQIFNVGERIRSQLSKKDVHNRPLISIESTVIPGTCEKVYENMANVNLVHVPHRYWPEDSINYGVKQLKKKKYLKMNT